VKRAIFVALAAALGLFGAAGAPVTVPSPGLYVEPFNIAVYNGPDRPSDSSRQDHVLEIVRIDRTHAYIRTHMEFNNGHVCGIYGVATEQGGALIYRSHDRSGARCILSIRRMGSRVVFDDPDDICKIHFCGANGSFNFESFAVSSRRDIRYMKRLLASRQYAEAMAEWHQGH
jgi:hypothetical protein